MLHGKFAWLNIIPIITADSISSIDFKISGDGEDSIG